MDYKSLIELIEEHRRPELRKEFLSMHPADIARLLDNLNNEQQIYTFSLLPPEIASDVLSEVNDETRDNILEVVNHERLITIIGEMETDEAADIISDLEDDLSRRVLANIDHDDSESIRELLRYDEETAGGLMQTEIIAVDRDMTRAGLLEYIRQNYQDVERFHYVFVTNVENKLLGVLDLSRVILARDTQTAGDLMDKDIFTATVDMDQEQVADLFRKYDLYALPVLDGEGRLLGRITVDDIIDVIDDEASEDAYRMVGLENEDRVFTAPLNSVRKRLPWLALNLLTAFLVSSVVGIFEGTIQKLSILAVLMPIVAGLGGNSGTQTLTVITRGIALKELTVHNTWRAMFKEITVGLVNGLLIGSCTAGIAFLFKADPMLGLVLGAAMVANMFIAGLVGTTVPLLMKRMHIDPALGSSVIITMLTDMGGFASFLGLATMLLF